jgi:hypothetical protein
VSGVLRAGSSGFTVDVVAMAGVATVLHRVERGSVPEGGGKKDRDGLDFRPDLNLGTTVW